MTTLIWKKKILVSSFRGLARSSGRRTLKLTDSWVALMCVDDFSANLLVQDHISIIQGPLLICTGSQILCLMLITQQGVLYICLESRRGCLLLLGKKWVSQVFHLNNGKTLTVSVSAEFYLQRHRCLECRGSTRQDPRSPAGMAARPLHRLHLIN